MERPGLLEFALYALVLASFAGWVYALPPFTYWPGTTETAQIQPAAATSSEASSEQSDIVLEVGGEDPVETQAPAATQAAAETGADEQLGPELEPDLLVVTAGSLNMRSEPNAKSALLGSYPRGSLVEKVETSGNWVRVRSGDQTGWMYAGYLAAEN